MYNMGTKNHESEAVHISGEKRVNDREKRREGWKENRKKRGRLVEEEIEIVHQQ